MNGLLDTAAIVEFWQSLLNWIDDEVLVASTLMQVAGVVAIVVVAWAASAPITLRGRALADRLQRRATAGSAAALLDLAFPIVAALLLWFVASLVRQQGWPSYILGVAGSLFTAWVVIRLASRLAPDSVWTRLIAVVAWVIVALNILSLLGPAVTFLDGIAVTLGELRVSALSLIKGVISLAVLLWIAVALSRQLERRIHTLTDLTPSVRVLLVQLLKIVLITIAAVAALSAVGIDLTAFAVFTGAIGVGVGFGLQKIIANFISGLILLLDKSIKPGDVLFINNMYGRINSLGARYVSVITRDSTEILIPNEDLIIQQVENWSFSNDLVRQKVTIGVHYQSDVREAIDCCLDAARNTERVLADPEPRCFIQGFGDSSVDLTLRYWINDPMNGIANVRGAVLLGVWDRFHERGVEIPYPQRDLHIRSAPGLNLTTNEGAGFKDPSPA